MGQVAHRWAARGLSALLLAALMPLASAQGVAAADDCTAVERAGNPVPIYPVDELWRLSSHTVTVLLEADACGAARAVRLERSSGIAVLDEQALAAARQWVIAPEWRGRAGYRLPFDFMPLPQELVPQQGARVRDVFFDERRSGQVKLAEVTTLETARGLPGYLADPYPIGFLSLPEALETLHKLGLVKRYDNVVDIWLHDEEGVSLFQWFGPLLVRNRQVQQDGMTFVVSSALCGNELEACRQQLGRVQAARGRQFPVHVSVAEH